jgi:hypothetical protein
MMFVGGKASAVARLAYEGVSGQNWTGQKFKTYGDLIDDWKKSGNVIPKTTGYGSQWHFMHTTQFPAYVLSELIGNEPVQVSNLIRWMNGEIEGFDAVAGASGVQVSTSRKLTDKQMKSTKLKDAEGALSKQTGDDEDRLKGILRKKYQRQLSAGKLSDDEKTKYRELLSE